MPLQKSLLTLALLFFGLIALTPCADAQFPQLPDNLGPKVPQGAPGCSLEKSCAELAPQIIKSAEGPSPLAENLRYLTDVIGGRMTGTPAADKAVGWAVEAFRHAGVDEVHTEKFTVPAGWMPGRGRADLLEPVASSLRIATEGWSAATPEQGITSTVVDVGDGDEAAFAKAGTAASGSILLVHTKELVSRDDLANEYPRDSGIVGRAKQAGAAAILWMSTRPYLLLYRRTLTMTGEIEPLPQAILAREDAQRIARFIAAGESVRIHLEMPNHVASDPVTSENVVAEMRGRENPGEFIVLAAQLDSWDLGSGALDEGCNAALVIDAARAIHSTGTIPRRSIRFVLFTGQEQGMLGSWAYAKAHRAELSQIDAVIAFGSGNGQVTGYSLEGRQDAAVRDALAPAEPLGANSLTFEAHLHTSAFDFLLEGIPTLVANRAPDRDLINYAAVSDTYDKVDITELKKQAALAAITAFALADRTDAIAERQSRVQIESLLKDTGLEDQMRATGLWPLWDAGTRGRQP